MNQIEKLAAENAAIRKRLAAIEKFIRPLEELEGVDADLLGDQAIIQFIAESCGSTLPIVTGSGRNGEQTEARRFVARQARKKLKWSVARIGRNLGRTESGIRKLLRSDS